MKSSESHHNTSDTNHSSHDDLLCHSLACVLLVTYQNHWQCNNLSTCWCALCWSLASVPLSSRWVDSLGSQIKFEHCQCCNKAFMICSAVCQLWPWNYICHSQSECNFPSVVVLTGLYRSIIFRSLICLSDLQNNVAEQMLFLNDCLSIFINTWFCTCTLD